ncbi:DinB family protein [Adhaeribacter sp. BT258]|uniref:DinB family protein n=1 Tax=Adhaeribacter terrigena TaxID=2793070 RepID=A0ABS1C005_9BACT|nr:DinB family protein [Adhaeribacter terrigena]MBK0402674.1 DinB family protein [Adhaeribacter terrigena]
MYRKIEDFLSDWEYETEMTAKVFGNLKEEHLNHSFHSDNRTLGRLAWHITHTLGEMMHRAGLPVNEMDPEPESLTLETVIAFYNRDAVAVKEAVKATWTDEELEEKVPMYGDNWSKGYILTILIRHQTHHRGQMTVLMRQAGLKVPGIYGPSKEEWIEMGMPALP